MNGRLEALITIPAGATLTVDDGGGADVATISDGSYYWTELLAEIESELEDAVGAGFTVTGSFGELGTGIITVAKNSGTFKLLFSSDALANLFGVAAAGTWNGAPAASFSGTAGVRGVWLPHCPVSSDERHGLDFDLAGHYDTDERQTIGPTGNVATFISTSTFAQFPMVRWTHVDRDRALYGVNPAVHSWQAFRRLCLRGGDAFFPISDAGLAPTVKYFYNADTNTVCGAATGADGVYSLVLAPGEGVQRTIRGFNGYWTVEIQQLVKVD